MSWWHRAWQYMKSHSLVLSTLETRLKLLKRHGIKMRASEDDMELQAMPAPDKPAAAASPRRNLMGREAWNSDSLLTYAETLFLRVMDRWHADVAAEDRVFVVLYIPRAKYMHLPIDEQDSWARWTREYCSERGIPLVDPTQELVARQERGEEVIYDHFTPVGHRAVADAFLDRLAE